MAYSDPARTAVPRPQVTVYGRRPHRVRQRVLLAAVLVLLLAATVAGAGHRRRGQANPPTSQTTDTEKSVTSLSPVTWPAQGQAALVLGTGRPAASPHQQRVPIASLAKVMTAYLTLSRYPLTSAQDGFELTVTPAQAEAEAEDASQGQSVVVVRAGEQLTERQLLEALLIPSGNNAALMLATRVAGSRSRFVAEMNAQARALGMDHTVYTDPSGFDPGTVSTAADQLRVFQQAMRFAIFRQIVSMPSVTLPVAGMLSNYDPLIAEGYAGKTGSDPAAGGCLAFFTNVEAAGRRVTAVGVVMGQGQGGGTSELLGAAGQAATQLVESVAPATAGSATVSPDGRQGPAAADRRPPAPSSPSARP